MAVKKATTTADLTVEAAAVADGYAVLVGPDGKAVTVPASIVDALVDSGYEVK